MKPTLTVSRWRDFQHYKDRAPIWIKVHVELLHDDEWHELSDASKAHVIGIWLLAAATNTDGKVPFKPNWISRQIGATTAINWREIAESKFVSLNQSAIDLLAETVQVDSSRALARVETEGETEKTPPVVPLPGDQAPVQSSTPEKPKRERAARTKLPEGWMPEKVVVDEMRAECPGLDLKREHAKFTDHWIGTGDVKASWSATWRNWMRRAYERRGPPGAPSTPTTATWQRAPEKPE